jgi:putative endonuclease
LDNPFTDNTRQIGKNGEDIAVKWLKNNGHRVIARNYRKSRFEVDIISIDNKNILRFIEVKMVINGSEELASYSIESRNIGRYFKVVECFLSDYPEYLNKPICMDAVVIHNKNIKYYQNITSTYVL